MKLSEEMSLGRMLLKPVPGTENDGDGGGCAIGMARAAAGGGYVSIRHPWLMNAHNGLPCKCDGPMLIGGGMREMPRNWVRCYQEAIVHIFNYHVCTVKDWTMDQLIDFVKRVEPKEEKDATIGSCATGVAGDSVHEPVLVHADTE